MPSELIRRDRNGAALGAFIWIVGAFKVAPQMPRSAHMDSAVGAVTMVVVGIVWPRLHQPSYLRWRTAALAGTRLLLLALPTNYNSALFDAMTPALASGRFAPIISLSTFLLGTHVCLLLFLALLLPLPLRPHMRVHTVSVAMLMCFAVHTHCQSRLFNTPEFAKVVGALHDGMSLVSLTLASATQAPLPLSLPPGSYAQSVAVLLMIWAVIGWLLPTLMLLVPGEAPQQPAPEPSDAGMRRKWWRLPAAACGCLEAEAEAWLRRLLPRPWPGRHPADERAALFGTNCVLWWLFTLCVLWLLCCAVAPLYSASAAAP